MQARECSHFREIGPDHVSRAWLHDVGRSSNCRLRVNVCCHYVLLRGQQMRRIHWDRRYLHFLRYATRRGMEHGRSLGWRSNTRGPVGNAPWSGRNPGDPGSLNGRGIRSASRTTRSRRCSRMSICRRFDSRGLIAKRLRHSVVPRGFGVRVGTGGAGLKSVRRVPNHRCCGNGKGSRGPRDTVPPRFRANA